MLGINLATPQRAPWWPAGARFAADFVSNRYMIEGLSVARANAIGFSRGSAKLAQDSAGIWRSFAPDVPAITDRGLLLEPAATNMVPNSAMVGTTVGIVGAGGTLPTGWTSSAFDTITVKSTGTEDGLPLIELRLQGTNSTGATRYAFLRAVQAVPALIGQQWTASAFYKLIAGAWHPNGSSFLNVEEKGSSTSYRITARTADMTARTRLTRSWTTDRPGTILLTFSIAQFDLLQTEVIDVTLRIYAPQLSVEVNASSPITTTGTANTRAADTITLSMPSGTLTLTRTLDDASTQTISGAAGNYELSNATAAVTRLVTAI